MQTVIAMLRGINVSGQKKIAMSALKVLFEELGFKNVSTYIQSGNIIFTVDARDNQALSKKIEEKIQTIFGFSVPVILRTLSEMEQLIAENPFLKQDNIDREKLHVTFLKEQPDSGLVDKLKTLNYSPDQFVISGKEIYLYCPNGYGITKLSNSFVENKLKVTATTRNWKTINMLIDLTKR